MGEKLFTDRFNHEIVLDDEGVANIGDTQL